MHRPFHTVSVTVWCNVPNGAIKLEHVSSIAWDKESVVKIYNIMHH